MKKVFIIIVAAVLACSGCSHRIYPAGSNSIDTVYVEKTVTYRDTVLAVALPPESVDVQLPADTSSCLRTSVAESYAEVTKGILHHSLRNLSQPITMHVLIPQTTVSTNEKHSLVRTVVHEVEKPLKWWQKTLMWIGVIGIVYVAIRIIRVIR